MKGINSYLFALYLGEHQHFCTVFLFSSLWILGLISVHVSSTSGKVILFNLQHCLFLLHVSVQLCLSAMVQYYLRDQ